VGQSPLGISGTGPLVGPPALNKSLGGCGVGDAEALLGADALLLLALLSGGGVLVGGLLAGGGVLVGGLLAPLPTAAATGVSSLAGSS
jgi:hypothetical protein